MNKNITAIFGVLGTICALAGLFVFAIFGEMVWLYTTLELLAVLQLGVFFITHFETLKDISAQRSTKFGANSFLMAIIFIAILSILNFILARHEVRFDLSDTGAFSLSPQTESILENLEADIQMTGFFNDDSEHRSRAKDLLENYARLSRKVDYVIIDPDKKPSLVKQYGVTDYDKIVVESEGRSVIARDATEAAVTSALIRTSRKKEKTFYFVEGHGERNIDDTEREGYSLIKETLSQQGFTVKKLLLLFEKQIPEDADVVIIAGPKRPFGEAEHRILQDYLDRRGRLFLALDPMRETGLEAFLSKRGILLKNDLILAPGSGLGAAIPTVSPGSYPEHDITKGFDLATFFPLSRSVAFDPAGAGDYQFSPFLQSGPETWLTEHVEGDLSVNPARDQQGPIVFGGVLTAPPAAAPGDPGAGRPMRVVIVGDSDFGSNGISRSAGNADLFQNILSWLADEGDLVSIRPKEIPTATLLLNDKQTGVIFSVSVLILPLGVMGMGLLIWRKRRQL
ncbi:MAG: GldG family protein [Nitrospiria bacterium]